MSKYLDENGLIKVAQKIDTKLDEAAAVKLIDRIAINGNIHEVPETCHILKGYATAQETFTNLDVELFEKYVAESRDVEEYILVDTLGRHYRLEATSDNSATISVLTPELDACGFNVDYWFDVLIETDTEDPQVVIGEESINNEGFDELDKFGFPKTRNILADWAPNDLWDGSLQTLLEQQDPEIVWSIMGASTRHDPETGDPFYYPVHFVDKLGNKYIVERTDEHTADFLIEWNYGHGIGEGEGNGIAPVQKWQCEVAVDGESGETKVTWTHDGDIRYITTDELYSATNDIYSFINNALEPGGDIKNVIDSAVASKQDTLVSGTNIKTINNQSILGSGNIDIQGGGEDPTDVAVIAVIDVLADRERYAIPGGYTYQGSTITPLDPTAGFDSWVSAGQQIAQQLRQDHPNKIVLQCTTFKGTLDRDASIVAPVVDAKGSPVTVMLQATYDSDQNAWVTPFNDGVHYVSIEDDDHINSDWKNYIHGLLYSYLMLTTSQLQRETPYEWTEVDNNTASILTGTEKIGLILDQGNYQYVLTDSWENTFSYRQVKLQNFVLEIASDLQYQIEYRLKKPLDEVVVQLNAESIDMNALPPVSGPIQLEVIVDRESTYYSAFCKTTPVLDYKESPNPTVTITINNTDRKIVITPDLRDSTQGNIDWSQFPASDPVDPPVELTAMAIVNGSCLIDDNLNIIDAVDWPTEVPAGPFEPNIVLKLANAEQDQYGYAVVDKATNTLTVYLLDDRFNYVDADMIVKYHHTQAEGDSNEFTIVTSHLSRQDDDNGQRYLFDFDACALLDGVLTTQVIPEK